MFLKYKHIY